MYLFSIAHCYDLIKFGATYRVYIKTKVLGLGADKRADESSQKKRKRKLGEVSQTKNVSNSTS